MNTAKRKPAPISLDKQIKEMAAKQLDKIVEDAAKELAKARVGTPLATTDVARLVSCHKPKSTYDSCVKQLAESISKNMLASLGNKEPDGS